MNITPEQIDDLLQALQESKERNEKQEQLIDKFITEQLKASIELQELRQAYKEGCVV